MPPNLFVDKWMRKITSLQFTLILIYDKQTNFGLYLVLNPGTVGGRDIFQANKSLRILIFILVSSYHYSKFPLIVIPKV